MCLPKTCGKVLTSHENILAIEKKEQKKAEEERKKQERREKGVYTDLCTAMFIIF